MTGLVALVYGSSQIPSTSGWILTGVGIVMLFLFWMIETRVPSPMFETDLFMRNKLFCFSNVAALINYTATSGIVLFLSLYLQKVQGLSPRDAGAVIIAQPVVMALFSPVVGRLSDRIQPRYFATAGMAICSVGLFAISFFTAETPLWLIVLVLIWKVSALPSFFAQYDTIMSSGQEPYSLGHASSMRIFGQIAGMTIVTFFFAFYFENHAVTEVDDAIFLTAMKWGFVTFALISLAGIYFSFRRGDVNRS